MSMSYTTEYSGVIVSGQPVNISCETDGYNFTNLTFSLTRADGAGVLWFTGDPAPVQTPHLEAESFWDEYGVYLTLESFSTETDNEWFCNVSNNDSEHEMSLDLSGIPAAGKT